MHCSLCWYTDLSLILVAATTTEFNFCTINSWNLAGGGGGGGVLDLA